MEQLEKGYLVRVRPEFWDSMGHAHDVGTVVDIYPHSILSVLVEFNGVKIFVSAATLERI